jgi:ABC-type uncharacterized transport system permease subunit
MNRFSTSITGEAGAQLSLCVVERFFGVHSGAEGFVIAFLALARNERPVRVQADGGVCGRRAELLS